MVKAKLFLVSIKFTLFWKASHFSTSFKKSGIEEWISFNWLKIHSFYFLGLFHSSIFIIIFIAKQSHMTENILNWELPPFLFLGTLSFSHTVIQPAFQGSWPMQSYTYIRVAFLKVRQIRNYFFKPRYLPKNEQTNSTLLLVDLFSFVFWKKVKTPKRHFEINWPL